MHFMRARWNQFLDGTPPGNKVCKLDPRYDMITGNFAHRKKCCIKCDVWWSETSVAVHDCYFLNTVMEKHPLDKIPKSGSLAGWRRIHPHNMALYADSRGYKPKARDVLQGMLEPYNKLHSPEDGQAKKISPSTEHIIH